MKQKLKELIEFAEKNKIEDDRLAEMVAALLGIKGYQSIVINNPPPFISIPIPQSPVQISPFPTVPTWPVIIC